MEFGPILRAMGRNKVRFGLIVCEIALTLAIVANCVTVILHTRRQMVRPSGFDDDNIVSVRSTPFDKAFRENGYLNNALQQDLAALRALPGVRAVSNTRFLPWQGGGSSTEMRPQGSQGTMFRTQIYSADEGTFETLGVRVVEGRSFSHDDVERDDRRIRDLYAGPRALADDGRPQQKFSQDVVVSRAFAKLVFGEASPLGKVLEDSDGDMYPIVGVIDDFYNPYGWPIHEYAVFYANWSRGYEAGSALLVRTEPQAKAATLAAIEQKLLSVNGGRNVTVTPLTEVKARYFAGSQLVVNAMTGVAFLLVFITSLGIVGVTSFSVTERTRQIGTRRALGARRSDVVRYFLLENWLLTGLGLGLGLVLAYGLNVGLLTLAPAADAPKLTPSLVAIGALLLWSAGLLATLAPALRGARVSPAVATRNV